MRYKVSNKAVMFYIFMCGSPGERQDNIKTKEESKLFQRILSLRHRKDRETNLTEKMKTDREDAPKKFLLRRVRDEVTVPKRLRGKDYEASQH